MDADEAAKLPGALVDVLLSTYILCSRTQSVVSFFDLLVYETWQYLAQNRFFPRIRFFILTQAVGGWCLDSQFHVARQNNVDRMVDHVAGFN